MSKKGCIVVVLVIFILGLIFALCIGACVGSVVLLSEAGNVAESSNNVDIKVIQKGGDDKIAIIKVEGIIMDVESSTDIFGSTYASSSKITKYIDNAMQDDHIKVIILDMNTPGGDVYASDIIHNKIVEAQLKGIKIVTLMRNTAASGGYYVAAPSDKIVANALTITGSIGVRLDFQSLEGLYEKLGIKTKTITNTGGKYKTGEGVFDNDPNNEEKKIFQTLVDEAFDRFVTVIAEGRHMDKSAVLKIADGRVYTGKQAKEVGLVDELGDYDTAVSVAEREAGISDPTIIQYQDNDFLSLLLGTLISIVKPEARMLSLVDTTPGPKLLYLYDED
jgi:protease-4